MKPQYAIGNLVQFTRGATTETGTITGQITRTAGFFYEVGESDVIAETDILSAFKPILKRTKKTRSTNAKKNASKNKETGQAAVQ